MNAISPSPAPKMPTLRHIAERVGVSAMTASVVLNGAKPGTIVAEATRRKIEVAAAELGYKRNGSMVAARTGKFGNIALLLSTESNRSTLPQAVWNGIYDELAKHNLSLSMARLPDETLTDDGVVPKILREWMCDGILVDYTDHIPARMKQLIDAHQLPVVWINAQQEADCVFPDDLAAGIEATERLLEMGHRRITYLDFSHIADDPNVHYSAGERCEGYETVMRNAGLKPHFVAREDVPRTPVSRDLAQLLEAQRPTALLCYGVAEAQTALVTAALLGWDVPQNVSVMTFERPNVLCAGYEITQLTVPETQVGREAVQMLMQKIEQPARRFSPRALPFGFQTGQTCRAL